MPSLDKMLNREVTLRFNFEGDAFELAYAPFTQETVDALLANDDIRSQARFNIRLLTQVLKKWDITDGAGQILPLTEANIARLPIDYLNLLVSRIQEDQQVGKRSDAQLSATLRREAVTTTSPSLIGSNGSKGADTWGPTP